MKTFKLKKIGDSYFIIVPKVLVEMFNLNQLEYELSINNNKDIRFYKLSTDNSQTHLSDFKSMKGGKTKDGDK